MGILKDLLNKGFIEEETYEELVENLEEEWLLWRHNLDPSSLNKIIEELEEIGAYDLAEQLTETLVEHIVYWHDLILEETGREVYYDPKVDRWRDWNTGQFVSVHTWEVRD